MQPFEMFRDGGGKPHEDSDWRSDERLKRENGVDD